MLQRGGNKYHEGEVTCRCNASFRVSGLRSTLGYLLQRKGKTATFHISFHKEVPMKPCLILKAAHSTPRNAAPVLLSGDMEGFKLGVVLGAGKGSASEPGCSTSRHAACTIPSSTTQHPGGVGDKKSCNMEFLASPSWRITAQFPARLEQR